MTKTAKDYYADVFEGIRLSVCGLAMLVVRGASAVCTGLKRLCTRRGRNEGGGGANGCEPEAEDASGRG